MREEMDEYEKQYTVHRKESEHGDETVHMSPVLLRKALAVLSDEQCEAFLQAVRSSAPPPPISAKQAELLIRDTAACAEGSASVLRHAHNPGHSLTCPTDSKVLTACSWMRADCQAMQQRSDHPPHGERALYNGQVWGRYDRSLHALVVTTRTRTDRGDICKTGRIATTYAASQAIAYLCKHVPVSASTDATLSSHIVDGCAFTGRMKDENKEGSDYFAKPDSCLYTMTWKLLAPLVVGNSAYPFIFLQGKDNTEAFVSHAQSAGASYSKVGSAFFKLLGVSQVAAQGYCEGACTV